MDLQLTGKVALVTGSSRGLGLASARSLAREGCRVMLCARGRARLAGAPKVRTAGVDLARKLGDAVAVGDLLYRVHAGFQSDLDFARQACDKSSGYQLGSPGQLPHVFVEF